MVPIIAARHARPVITDDWNYRCTPYAAMTPTWQQAYKKMKFKALPRISAEEARMALLTRDIFSLAVGSGYTSPATMLGLSGTGTFKSPMLMEKRDLLITAAVTSGEHAYAEYNIELYEADEPLDGNQSAIRNLRYEYQQQIMDFNYDRLQGILVDISRGIDGMFLYEKKFPNMMIDREEQFRKDLQETVNNDPVDDKATKAGVKLPSVRRETSSSAELAAEIMTLSHEAFDDEWEGPRNDFEAQQSFSQKEQVRLRYTRNQASFQHDLQKKTSEVTLSVQPTIQSMSELQIQASRSRADKRREETTEARGEDTKKRFAILNETEDLMRAQLKKGRFYAALSEAQKRDYNKILSTPPPKERVEWLVNKLATKIFVYEQFVEMITFCHVEKEDNDGFKFVLNYVHQDFILPELRQKTDQEKFDTIKLFYRRFYEGDGLFPLFVNEKIKTSLEYSGHYPEPPPSKLKKYFSS